MSAAGESRRPWEPTLPAAQAALDRASGIVAGPREVDRGCKVEVKTWPDVVRASPNSFLRSALFGVVKLGMRGYLEKKSLAVVSGCEVSYTGQQLDQADFDVWLNLVQRKRPV